MADGRYAAASAHRLTGQRRRAWPRPRRFDDATLVDHVKNRLWEDHSPEQIVGTWPASLPRVSVQTIYSFLKRDRPAWLSHLRQARTRFSPSYRQPHKYQRIRGLKPIGQRPGIVQQRSRVGDWESDTLRGADRQVGIATHVERRTGYVLLAKVEDRTAATYNQSTLAAFARERAPIRTMTVDRGMEFAKFAELETALQAPVYFADPHCAWQRGTNENTNGLLRQYFPKDRDFSTISLSELHAVQARVNTRPRKRHGYRTPADLMTQSVAFMS
jgi:IS30 family transposase